MPDRTHTVAHRSSAARRMRPLPAVRRHGGVLGHALASRLVLQPSLKVGAVDDPMEREAEVMAERVTGMAAPAVAAIAAPTPNTPPAARRASDDQPNLDSLEASPPVPDDHQDPVVPPAEDVTTEAISSNDMQEIETGEPKDTGGDAPISEWRSETNAVVGEAGGAAPADVAQRVAQPGAGRPMPSSLQSFMEPRFNRSFEDVRLHDEPQDRVAAARIGARAFTHRQHIWIGEGESAENRKLMAHELTHVVQQTAPEPAHDVMCSAHEEEPEIRRGYIANKAEKYARNVPGYRLISLILGKSPITGETVERNATNVLGALLTLIPGGNLLFERLEESRVIERAFKWIWDRLQTLDITWTRIKDLISKLIDYLPDWPGDVVDYAKKLFKPLVDDILTFIGEVTMKILEFIFHGALKLAGPWGDKIWDIIQRAGAAIKAILDDPLGFAKNLFSAVIKGFSQFGDHVVTHLKKGLLGWLFGAVKGLDIQMPERLDFKGLVSIGLQVVGLTYANFRKQLVKRLGDNGERKVGFLEKSVEVVKILLKEGFAGIWQRALQMIDNFKETVIGGIQSFVIESLIMGGLSWLAGLSNPVGAVIKIALAIYNMIKTFLERLDQILAVAEAIFSSITSIAAGRVQAAADFIEKTIASAIPVIISFLAALVPITGIVNAIHKIINKLRDAVTRAIDKMITFIVKKAKKLFSKLIGKLNNLRKLPSVNFTFGKKQHRIYAEKRGKKVEVLVASGQGHALDEVKADAQQQLAKVEDKAAKSEAAEVVSEVAEADKETDEKKKGLKPDSEKDNQLKGFAALEAELKEAAEELQQAGVDTDKYPELDTEQTQYLFRAKEPRFDDIEGKSDEYSALGKITSQVIKINGQDDASKRTYSNFYENDHIPEKQYPKAILAKIDRFKPGQGGNVVDRGSEKAETPPSDKEQQKPTIGKLGGEITSIPEKGQGLPAMSIYRPVHGLKKSTPPSTVERNIENATKEKDPMAAVKKLLSMEIKEEADKIAAIIKKDSSATDAIKSNLDLGVHALIAQNTALYALDKVEQPASMKGAADPNDKSLSNLPVTGNKEAGVPNFLDLEGTYKPYDTFDSGYGKFMEYDHVIDAAWPRHSAGLTFGHATLREKLKDALAAMNFDKEDKKQANRLSGLGEKRIFPARHGLSKYDEKSGGAIAVYRPVHRTVTRFAKAPSDDSVSSAAVGAAFATPLADYIVSGNTDKLDEARTQAQPGVKKLFEEKVVHHTDLIANQYVYELQAVKKVNAGKESLAQQAMVKISTNVRNSLQQARNETVNLFQ